MSGSELKKCPKCGEEMEKDRRLISYTKITLAKENKFVWDKINTFLKFVLCSSFISKEASIFSCYNRIV